MLSFNVTLKLAGAEQIKRELTPYWFGWRRK